jgi:hypothetical protein
MKEILILSVTAIVINIIIGSLLFLFEISIVIPSFIKSQTGEKVFWSVSLFTAFFVGVPQLACSLLLILYNPSQQPLIVGSIVAIITIILDFIATSFLILAINVGFFTYE